MSMVIANPTLTESFIAPPEPLVQGRWRVAPLTRAAAELLMRQGFIREDASTELLSGLIDIGQRA